MDAGGRATHGAVADGIVWPDDWNWLEIDENERVIFPQGHQIQQNAVTTAGSIQV